MRSRNLLPLFLILGLVACASVPISQNGFLSSYTDMAPPERVSSSGGVVSKRVATDPVGAYTGVYVAAPEIRATGLTDAQKQELQRVLLERLREKLEARVKIVESPGPGVLTLRTALTNVIRTDGRATLTYVLVCNLCLIAPRGGAAGEAEFVDAQTGAQVAAVMWSDRGDWFSVGASGITQARGRLGAFAAQIADLLPAKSRP